MHETGIENFYKLMDGKKLRFGYTTGTCAAAATKAATLLLVTGKAAETVDIVTPKGIALKLDVLEPRLGQGIASCAIRKYSGDDPDVTDGVLVYAEVCWQREPGVTVCGGIGIGRVTKPGLKQRVGEAAINPVPMEMIRQAVSEALSDCGQAEGIRVVISIPAGVALAGKTFNPRLGIEGGISVLGTSGIVEPMSEEALVDCIRLELRQKRSLGDPKLMITPGNYGADFLGAMCGVRVTELVKCANYIGLTLDMAVAEGFTEVLLVGHVGKLIKLSGGIMNTHSKEADARAELMAACALRAGCTGDTARAILGCITTDEMLQLLQRNGLMAGAMEAAAERIDFCLRTRVKDQLTVGAVVFSNEYGTLCMTGPAKRWLEELKEGTE
ncbi:MAG: cobalt-precorrin-5B (C(1))-methyltransferase CbiD [Candidatus Limiplasma sp.]|nr:cobalt-precorrin-5B (C(1))-methyltransferase CbiD [Candidatus Limiplasma sp.]